MLLTATAWAAPDEAPEARRQLDAIVAGLDAIELDLPRIAELADRAAEVYLNGGTLAVRGGALHLALANQAGGFNDDDGVTRGDVLLLASDDPGVRLTQGEATVAIAIGERPLPGALHLPLPNLPGIDKPGPARAAMLAAAAWTLRCEMYAACLRVGRVPVLRISDRLDSRQRHFHRYRDQRFHHDAYAVPVAPGELGRAYLSALRDVLGDIGTAAWPQVVAAAHAARDARRVIVHFGPAYAAHQVVHCNNLRPLDDADLSGGDMVIAFGDPNPEAPRYLAWEELEVLQPAGRIVWVWNACDLRPGDIPRRDIHLDPHWPLGDALVPVRLPHTATRRLGPASPVITAALLAILDAAASP